MPKHTTLVAHQVQVQSRPDGGRTLAFIDTTTGDITAYPMTPDLAETVGKQLVAPSIEVVKDVPNGNGRSAKH